MKSLRSKIIRLAHENPSLRAELLPLLKTASDVKKVKLLEVNETFKGLFIKALVSVDPSSLLATMEKAGLDPTIRPSFGARGIGSVNRVNLLINQQYGDSGVEEILMAVAKHRGDPDRQVEPEYEIGRRFPPAWEILEPYEGLLRVQMLILET